MSDPQFGHQNSASNRKPVKWVSFFDKAFLPMSLGFSEMAFLVILGLLLFGPKKLPEIGRQIGRILAEFKRASNEFQAQLNDEVRNLEIEEETKAHFNDLKNIILPPEGSTARN